MPPQDLQPDTPDLARDRDVAIPSRTARRGVDAWSSALPDPLRGDGGRRLLLARRFRPGSPRLFIRWHVLLGWTTPGWTPAPLPAEAPIE